MTVQFVRNSRKGSDFGSATNLMTIQYQIDVKVILLMKINHPGKKFQSGTFQQQHLENCLKLINTFYLINFKDIQIYCPVLPFLDNNSYSPNTFSLLPN